MSPKKVLFVLMASFSLTACDLLLSHDDQIERLNEDIRLERKKQELEKLKQTRIDDPEPEQVVLPSSEALTPSNSNQAPNIQELKANLITSVQANDSVDLQISASDPDADPLEYTWTSLFPGLSATRGEKTVWFPSQHNLAGRTNLITVTVNDRKGGTSTATLNIFVQDDGRLLLKEQTLEKPHLLSLQVEKVSDQEVRFIAKAQESKSGSIRYEWQSNLGLLSNNQTNRTIWTPQSNQSGSVVIKLLLNSADGSSQTSLEYQFTQQSNGQLKGDFKSIQNPRSISEPSTNPLNPNTRLNSLIYGFKQNKLYSLSLRTGQSLLLAEKSNQTSSIQYIGSSPEHLFYDVPGQGVLKFDLSELSFDLITTPKDILFQKGFLFQNQVYLLGLDKGVNILFSVAAPNLQVQWKTPQWLKDGPVSREGLVIRQANKSIYLANPRTGSEVFLKNLIGFSTISCWQPSGQQLAILDQNILSIFDALGNQVKEYTLSPAPNVQSSLIWLDENQALLMGTESVFYLETGSLELLPNEISQALKEMQYIHQGSFFEN